MNSLFNKKWCDVLKHIHFTAVNDNYNEALGVTFRFDSDLPYMSDKLIDKDKLQAMAEWYIYGDKDDLSITEHFPEYTFRITKHSLVSNYGYHMFTKQGLRKCAYKLIKDKDTRQAIWFISDNENMHGVTTDRLCTNSLQFFIRDNTLHVVIQMRSSNLLTLLPYDIEMFKLFYKCMYALLSSCYSDLKTGTITMQIGSLHFYTAYYELLTKN